MIFSETDTICSVIDANKSPASRRGPEFVLRLSPRLAAGPGNDQGSIFCLAEMFTPSLATVRVNQ